MSVDTERAARRGRVGVASARVATAATAYCIATAASLFDEGAVGQAIALASHDWRAEVGDESYLVKDVFVVCATQHTRLLTIYGVNIVLLAGPGATFVQAALPGGAATSRPVCSDPGWDPLWQVDSFFTLGGEQCDTAGVFSFTPDVHPGILVNTGAVATTGGWFLIPPLFGCQTAGPDERVRIMRLCIRESDWIPGTAVAIALTSAWLPTPHPSTGTEFTGLGAVLPWSPDGSEGPEFDAPGFEGTGPGGGGVWGGTPEAVVAPLLDLAALWRSPTGYITGWSVEGTELVAEMAWDLPIPDHLEPIGHGDFDGDGDIDVLLRSLSDGSLTMWLSDEGYLGGGAFVGPAPYPYPNQWSVLGVADVNGDGRDDILWRRGLGTTRTVLAWLMDGPTIVASTNLGMSIGLEFLGFGDFNGSGRTDLLWRSLTNTIVAWRMQANGGKTALSFANVPPVAGHWKPLAFLDLDGDGDDDILWHNGSTGQVNGWLVQAFGRASGGIVSNSVPASWRVVGRRDLNGDGTGDLLWRNQITGHVNAWCMQGLVKVSGGTVGPLPPSWSSF